MLFFLGILVGLVTLWVVDLYKNRRSILAYTSKFVSPPHHPIMGSFLYFPRDPSAIFHMIMQNHKTYGKNLAMWGILNDHQLAIANPKDVETVLSSSKLINKSVDYTFLHDWLGTGLLVSGGKKWHSRRKIITPTFHFTILEDFIHIFHKQSLRMIEKLKEHADSGKEFNMVKYCTLCALDVICEASMGTEINAQDQPDSEYVNAVKYMSLLIFRRFFTILKQFHWTFPLTGLYKEQKKALKVLHGFTDGVIQKRRQQLLKESRKSKDSKRKLNFLDILLNATTSDGEPLSNADIREEVDTFMFEGHDTTTSAVAFTFYHLSRNQEVQQKVLDEIVAVLGASDKNSYLDYKILQELKYLEMVIKESMRITPPVPMIGRELTEPTILHGVTVPAGTTINIPVYAMHHADDVFPEPEKFDPERFTLEEIQKRNPYAYIPFSAGPRNCIGQKFAMLEVKSILAQTVLNYKILPSETDIILQADLILKASNGVPLRLENRP